MRSPIPAACVLVIFSYVGCNSCSDVEVGGPVQVSTFPSADDVDDVQATALSAMFSADIHGDVPSDRRYLAVMLLNKQTPDADFLGRFTAQDTEVITHAEGIRREPKDRGLQTAGLYLSVDSIDWVDRNQATVEIMVGNGWAAAIYRLQLRKAKAGWSCVEIKRTAIS